MFPARYYAQATPKCRSSGPGGIKCSCCKPRAGTEKKFFRRYFRRAQKAQIRKELHEQLDPFVEFAQLAQLEEIG